jgi:hypothetical protein
MKARENKDRMPFFLYAASELFEIACSAVFALSIVLFGTEWQAWSLGILLFLLGAASQLAAERIGAPAPPPEQTMERPVLAA